MICQAIKKNGLTCGAKLTSEGLCQYKSHNQKNIVTSDIKDITINTTNQSSTDTIMCESQVKTENNCNTTGCSHLATDGQYCNTCSSMRAEVTKVITPVAAPVVHKVQKQPVVKKSKVITALLADDIEVIVNETFIKTIINNKAYDKSICTLLCGFKSNWFNNRDNLWNLAGFFWNMPLSNQLGFQSFLTICYSVFGKNFNIDSIVSIWNSWDNKYRPKYTMDKLKAIAGGTNPEKYKEWKDKYDPTPIEIKVEKKQANRVGTKPIDILRAELLEICKDRFRRVEQSGAIYERKYDYYYTHKFDSPEPFLTHIFRNNDLYSTSGSSVHKELIYFIKHIVHPDFDFISHDYDYIGFTNGVYDLSTATFIQTNDMNNSIQVRKLFNQEYSIAPTPLLDAYLSFQFHEDDIEFIYFMLGRAMNKLDDRFDFMILLYGQGGSGKSLLMKLIMETYAASQLGILSSSFQGTFGLSEFANRNLVCSDDMPSNLAKTLDKGDFLKMMTRGSISCPVKGKGSIEVHDWNIPTIINSNNLPNYKDESGEIVRRVMVINFENVIPTDQCNVNLSAEIINNEIGTFIHKCRSTYIKYKQQYHGNNVETFCPKVFLDNRKLLRLAVNNTCAFINEKFEYSECETDTMTVPQLNKLFKVWMKERYSLQRNCSDNINPQSIESLDSRMKYRKIMLCKHCKSTHKKNCCDKYARADRTSQDRVNNIKRKEYGDDPSEFEAFQRK